MSHLGDLRREPCATRHQTCRLLVVALFEGGSLERSNGVQLVGRQGVDLPPSSHRTGVVPGARYVELPGADHWPFAGDQTALVAEVERFVAEVAADQAAVAERVLATVLFTDVVDSTAQAAALGDRAWREMREKHDRIVRGQIVRHRGREVKTMGDGFLAVFDGPARAVRCARAICSGVQPLGLEIRAGLHTGEIELTGDDVAGVAVALGARVGALAAPGEVLVSSTVKDLVIGSGIVFEDRGVHELRGVPDTWRLFSAVGES